MSEQTGTEWRLVSSKYASLTDREFLTLIEDRLGKSPLIDELIIRLENNVDGKSEAEEADEALQDREKAHEAEISNLKDEMEDVKKEFAIATEHREAKCSTVKCPVCEAEFILTGD